MQREDKACLSHDSAGIVFGVRLPNMDHSSPTLTYLFCPPSTILPLLALTLTISPQTLPAPLYHSPWTLLRKEGGLSVDGGEELGRLQALPGAARGLCVKVLRWPRASHA